MKKKYAQKYAQIQKQIRFLPLLLIALLVLSGVFGTWYVKADDANDPEWRLEAELLSDAGAVIGNEEAYAGKVIIRLRIFLSDERDKKENDLDKGGAEADGSIEETERSKETEEPEDSESRKETDGSESPKEPEYSEILKETEVAGDQDGTEKVFPFREEWHLSADSARGEKLLKQTLNSSESQLESEWKLLPPESGEGENPDEQKMVVYEKKIELGGNTDWDTHYSGSVKVLDADGNFQEGAFAFTLDMTPPEGAIQVDSFRWNQLVYYPAEQNTLFLNREATVSYRAEDSCSGVRRVSYLSSDCELTEDELAGAAWSSEKADVISPGEVVYLYMRIEDMAGNVSYINTPRILADSQAPSAVVRIKTPEAADHIYRNDVRADIVVAEEGVSSGLAQVWMQISRNGGMTWENSEAFEAEANRIDFQRELFLSKEEYESDSVRIRVYVKDHAGNETLYETEPFFIDSTPPNISVEWDSDSGEAVNGSIFAESRRARIRIRDKFPDLSGIRISVSGKSIQPEWGEIPGGGEGTIYETKLNFWEDGNYELTIQAKDLAGNWSEMCRESFQIDQIPPECELIYGDGSGKNQGEYHDTGTLMVSIRDRNLSREETHLTVLEILPGEFREIKADAETWLQNGLEYRASFSFPEDGEYRILAESADLAGNHMQKLVERAAIDTTAPKLQVTGIEEGMTVSGSVSFKIEASDRFYQPDSLQVSLTSESGREASALLAASRKTAFGTGQRWEFSDLPHGESWDDRYILSVCAADRSGKETWQEIRFSLNRYGSHYYTDPFFERQLDAYYFSEAPSFRIWEENVGTLEFSQIAINHDGKVKLFSGSDYQEETYELQKRWNVFLYFLPDSLFSEEGRYSVTFYSVDASGNRTDSEGGFRPIQFVVDHSAPSIALTDLENGGYYSEESRQFSVTVLDNIRMKRLVIQCGDQHLEISGEELEAERGICSLELFAGEDWQKLELWAEDAAGNRSDVTSVQVMVCPEGNVAETVSDAERAFSGSEKGERLRVRSQKESDDEKKMDGKNDTIFISWRMGVPLFLFAVLAGIGSSLWIKSKNNRSKSRNRGHRGKKEGRASGVSAELLQTEILIRKENTKEKDEKKDEEKDEEKEGEEKNREESEEIE